MRTLLFLQLAALLSACLAELQLASVLFRHGHRNIMRTYNFDPYSNVSYWPGGVGQITNRGKMQMYQFGQRLREQYSGLLSEQYTPEEILVRSSSYSRCVSSALCVLAGLFPPVGNELWNPSLLWQPIPVYADRNIRSNLLQSYADCPAYKEEFKRQMDTPELRAVNSNYSDVYRIVSEHWEAVHDFEKPSNLYDHFKIEEERGFKLPNWTEGMYPDKLREIGIIYQEFRTRSPLMLRLKMGPLVKDIVERMTAKRNGTARRNRRLYLYSGHDDNITGMLAVLGQPRRFVVQYGAAISFQLHSQPSGEHHVKVFFMPNTDLEDVHEVQIPGCGPVCELDTFVEVMSPVIPNDWDKECQLKTTSTS